MSELQLKTATNSRSDKHPINLSLIEFEEDSTKIVYCPALDISGYGYSSAEAKESFFEAFQEFLRYTTESGTLYKNLEKLGWTIEDVRADNIYIPPKDSDLVSLNTVYNEIVNNRSYKVSKEDIEFTL